MELHIVLYEPEIPQNTGSIGRTCLALNAKLHLIEPLGFSLEDKYLRRSGLDYWKKLAVECHSSWLDFRKAYPNAPLWFFTTKAGKRVDKAQYEIEAFLVFGKETAGLPHELLLSQPERCLRIPMLSQARSLNLAVSVGIAAYEVHRQNHFKKMTCSDPNKCLFNPYPVSESL